MLNKIGAYDGISGILCSGTYGEITEAINSALEQENSDIPQIQVEQTITAFLGNMKYGELEPACEHIEKVFEELKAHGLQIGMVTSDNLEAAEICLKELGILKYFDVIYADDGIHPHKPDPYYLNCFCEKNAFKPEEVVMVGDTLTDCEFAEKSGAQFIGVAKTEDDRQLLMQKAKHVVENISYVEKLLGSM